MKAIINKKIIENLFFLPFFCLGIFLFSGNAIGMGGGGPGADTPATIGGTPPDGETGTFYSTTLNGGGCDSNYRWTLLNGNLPSGLAWPGYPGEYAGKNLTISGTPDVVGTFGFKLQLSGSGCTNKSKSFTVNIITGSDPIITTTDLLWGLEGVTYNESVIGAQGTTPYTWSVSSGDFPPGLTLDVNTGAISGTLIDSPVGTLPAVYIFTVMLTDATSKTDSKEFSIGIQPYLQIITREPILEGMEGVSYSITFAGTGGNGSPYVWSLPGAGNDPGLLRGLILNSSTGELSGIPIQEGYYTFTVRLADGSGNYSERAFSLKINAGSLAFDTTVLPPGGIACETYSALVKGIGGTAPYSWSITGGSLPPGLIIDASGTPSTTISGAPVDMVGTFTFTVSLTDAIGTNRQRAYFIEVTGDPSKCSVSMDDNTAYPPFISTSTTPNVLLVLDNSGSMYEFAYKSDGDGNSTTDKDTGFVEGQNYYGYFECSTGTLSAGGYIYNSASSYTYNATDKTFGRQGAALALEPVFFTGNADGNGDIFDGCFLNWLTMRRVDVARKVLVGGKYDSVNNYVILAEGANRNFWKEFNAQTYYAGGGFPYAKLTACSSVGKRSCSGVVYDLKIKVASEPKGLIQETYSLVRWGLMNFNTYEGGYVSIKLDGGPSPIDATHFNTLVDKIRTVNPTTWTPLAETLYEAIRYYQHTNSAYNSGVDYSTWDDPIQLECQKNFVIVLTDGESSKDETLPNSCLGGSISDPNLDIQDYMNRIANNEGPTNLTGIKLNGVDLTWGDQDCKNANTIDGTFYLEGVAYYANTNDIRPDLSGIQSVTTYTVFAFDESPVGATILQTAAKYGAFKDSNGNNIPDLQAEWDKDSNGIPDKYFEAAEGSSLAIKLKRALFSILQKKSSGTSAAVLATTSKGESAAYQAYFQPTMITPAGSADWIGGVFGLFLDKYGNIREDTRGDAMLCYGPANPPGCTDSNKIVQMYYDSGADKIFARLYPGTVEADGTPTGTPVEGVEVDDVKNLWNAGDKLWARNAGDRNILTTLNGYEFTSTGLPNVDALTGSTFYDGNAAELQVALGVGDAAISTNIINYIRGVDIPGFRPRTVGFDLTGNGNVNDPGEIKVWKLGDIVYSTPVVVTRPRENYDFLYKDADYFSYLGKYFNRRHVVYAGANDGMLHAFNAGFYDTRKLRYCKGGDADANGIISDTECANGTLDLGDELWGFVPRGVLSNLKLLASTDYTHVYYVDLKPKTTDVKIFNCDATHPGSSSDPVCWGSILIGGLRYGAKSTPEYFALDVTDPENPRLLWTFSEPDMGLSMSRPAVAKTCDSGGTCKWFAIFGAGATGYVADSDLTTFSAANGNIYVLDISSAVPGDNGVIKSWGEFTNFWKKDTGKSTTFMSDPITVDGSLDYTVDVIYIADNYQTGGYVCSYDQTTTCTTDVDCTTAVPDSTCLPKWGTRILKLTTGQGTLIDPLAWKLSTLADVGSIDTGNLDKTRRITAAPSISKDEQWNMWVFFGTGSFLGLNDKNRVDTGAFYAVKDKYGCWDNDTCAAVSNLYDVANDVICPENDPGSCTASTGLGQLEYDIEQNYDGWVMYFETLAETVDFTGATLLHTGERVLSKPLVLGGLVTWTTYIPGDQKCNPSGESNVYSVYYKTGSSYNDYVFNAQAYKVEQNNTPEAVARVTRLGVGMASSPSVQVTEGGKAIITISDDQGRLLKITTIPPRKVKSEPTTIMSRGIYDPVCQ